MAPLGHEAADLQAPVGIEVIDDPIIANHGDHGLKRSVPFIFILRPDAAGLFKYCKQTYPLRFGQPGVTLPCDGKFGLVDREFVRCVGVQHLYRVKLGTQQTFAGVGFHLVHQCCMQITFFIVQRVSEPFERSLVLRLETMFPAWLSSRW